MQVQKLNEVVWASQLNLDLDALKKSSITLENFVTKRIIPEDFYLEWQAPAVTKLHPQYNLFMYAFPGFHDLFVELKNTFNFIKGKDNTEKYYLKCWLNCYYKDDYLGWHNHDDSILEKADKKLFWHGFYCINAEGSKTTYQIDNKEFDIESKDNQLILINDNSLQHRTWPWLDDKNPRITVAYNFYPEQAILKMPSFAIKHCIIPI